MAYQAIYRKWRPAVFEDIVGQNHITTTLKNQVVNKQISHAYLFCGTRGTGKTTCAKVFSRAVNCQNPQNGSPCNECEICKGILDGSIMDVTEIDAASNNGVENIRQLREDVNYVATTAKYRVYIIDEVHMLSDGAFNALLKTLEEPPEHVIFILATTEAHKVPQTILSRCQRYDFKRIEEAHISARMKEIAHGEGINIKEQAVEKLARIAEGSMRDALSLLERCVCACGDSIDESDVCSVLGISDRESDQNAISCIIDKSTTDALLLIEKVVSDGRDLNLFVDNLIKYIRDLIIVKVSLDAKELLNLSDAEFAKMKNQANELSFEKLSSCAEILNTARNDARWTKSPRVIYELAFIKMTIPELDDSKETLLARIKELEEKADRIGEIKIEKKDDKKEVKEKEKKEKKEKKVSAKLFSPIDISSLTSKSPIVVAARMWDKISREVAKKFPHIAHCVTNRKITIDNEGIILIYEESEVMQKNITATYINNIKDVLCSMTGEDFAVKTAFREDIEDNIIDYWSIEDKEEKKDEKVEIEDEKKDPIDRLINKFPEIVKVTDESEFLDFDSSDQEFSQSEMDEEMTEEYFTDDEKKQME